MKSVLFSFGPFQIYSYGFFICLGILAGLILSKHTCKKTNLDFDLVTDCFFISGFASLIGAKLFYLITAYPLLRSDSSLFKEVIKGGFVVYGGIIFAYITSHIFLEYKKIDPMRFFDIAAPCMAIGQGFGRIGCFMSGCCYGAPTLSPFGISFPNSPFCDSLPRYPTQLMSSIFDFALCGYLLLILNKQTKSGTTTYAYFLFYSIGRFMIEYFRGDPRGNILGVPTSQFISGFIICICIVIAIREYNLAKRRLK